MSETETITWRPVREIEPGRLALLRCPTNPMELPATVFLGWKAGLDHFMAVGMYSGFLRDPMPVDPTHFAYVEGL